MALHGPELLELATDNQCDLFYEASVAGEFRFYEVLSMGYLLTASRK